jgi:hypothetical protein
VLVSRRPGALTAWGSAFLVGAESADHTDDAMRGDDALHRVAGVPGEDRTTTVAVALGRLRTAGVNSLRLVLPEPGDLTGMAGPPDVGAAATAAGCAVLTVAPPTAPSWALIPTVEPSHGGDVVRWDLVEVAPTVPPHGLPTLGEADRLVAEAMREATASLDVLDVAAGREEVAARLAGIERGLRRLDLPASLPARAQRLVASGSRLLAITVLAADSDGAAVTAADAVARAEALRPLRRAARYALCAGYSALADPTSGADPGPR